MTINSSFSVSLNDNGQNVSDRDDLEMCNTMIEEVGLWSMAGPGICGKEGGTSSKIL